MVPIKEKIPIDIFGEQEMIKAFEGGELIPYFDRF
jgi:hypothetical protein